MARSSLVSVGEQSQAINFWEEEDVLVFAHSIDIHARTRGTSLLEEDFATLMGQRYWSLTRSMSNNTHSCWWPGHRSSRWHLNLGVQPTTKQDTNGWISDR